MPFGSFTRQFCQFGSFVGNGRSNARPVKPVGTFHNGIEIKICGSCFGNGRMSTVINDLARAHGCTCFEIINADTIAATGNKIGFYTVFAQCIYSRLTNFMFRKFGYEIGIVTIIGTTNRYIGFATSVNHIKYVRLYKSCIARG